MSSRTVIVGPACSVWEKGGHRLAPGQPQADAWLLHPAPMLWEPSASPRPPHVLGCGRSFSGLPADRTGEWKQGAQSLTAQGDRGTSGQVLGGTAGRGTGDWGWTWAQPFCSHFLGSCWRSLR